MANRLEGKRAIVTGAGSGIGEAIATRFIEEGATVLIADISGAQNAVAERLGAKCRAIQTDVSKSEDIQAMIAAANEFMGGLDILVNNAAIEGGMAKTADYAEEEFDHVWRVNGLSVFLGMKYAIPLMAKDGGGSIINTASMAAMVAFPSMPAYCAAKGAVKMLSKCAAVEHAAEGIRVNSICPGTIMTNITKQLPPEYIDKIIAANPAGRIADPSEVGDLAVFLGSDESRFITGTEVLIDGGYTAV